MKSFATFGVLSQAITTFFYLNLFSGTLRMNIIQGYIPLNLPIISYMIHFVRFPKYDSMFLIFAQHLHGSSLLNIKVDKK